MTTPTKDKLFSTREVPWMKLGRIEDQPKTAKEAAELGGLDFTVSLQDVAYRTKVGSEWHKIPSRRAIVADDNGDFMGFVSSSSYHSLQYGEAFDFMDNLGQPYDLSLIHISEPT